MRKQISSAIAAFALCGGIAAAQSSVAVTLNGNPMQLNPGPEVRAGRVFVPLRGVFEQLGASVVYANGRINAQKGRDHSVSLQIGSTQATVDGQPQTLDVAPFIVGASTYVPLRFVSQSLGAVVNYDANDHLVAIVNGPQQTAGGPPPDRDRMAPPPERLAPPPDRSGVELGAVRPGRDQVIDVRRPTIEADFADGRVNPNSLRMTLDGVNVTDRASRSPRGIVYSPPSDLQWGRHQVRVAGTDTNGQPFTTQWSFTTSSTVGDR